MTSLHLREIHPACVCLYSVSDFSSSWQQKLGRSHEAHHDTSNQSLEDSDSDTANRETDDISSIMILLWKGRIWRYSICLEFLTLTHPEFKAYLNLVRCGFCPGQGRMEPLLIILRYVRVRWTGPNSSCRGLGEGRSWVYMNLLLSSFSSTLKGNSWVVQLCDQDASWVPLAYDEDPEHAGEITFAALN